MRLYPVLKWAHNLTLETHRYSTLHMKEQRNLLVKVRPSQAYCRNLHFGSSSLHRALEYNK